MTPTPFPESNCVFGPPVDMEESQVQRIPAYTGQIKHGSCDGAAIVITAWQPSESELKALQEGKPIFLSCIGGLPPHYICTSFIEALNVA